MESLPSSPRSKRQYSRQQFDHRLNMYSIAAGAAGVGLLALAQPANAEIVYTPANVTISTRGVTSYALDLSGSGTTDFFLSAVSRESVDTSGGTSRLIARAAARSNAVVGYGGDAAALTAGQHIAAGRKFKGSMLASLHTFIGTEFTFRGQWVNVKDRYLGLEFQIDGQTHYGWARLSVVGKTMTAKLTGYAYETTPDTPIVAGKTSGTDAASLSPTDAPILEADAHGASLGALALGASSLSAGRRDEGSEAASVN
jgi:hypothetical protein